MLGNLTCNQVWQLIVISSRSWQSATKLSLIVHTCVAFVQRPNLLYLDANDNLKLLNKVASIELMRIHIKRLFMIADKMHQKCIICMSFPDNNNTTLCH